MHKPDHFVCCCFIASTDWHILDFHLIYFLAIINIIWLFIILIKKIVDFFGFLIFDLCLYLSLSLFFLLQLRASRRTRHGFATPHSVTIPWRPQPGQLPRGGRWRMAHERKTLQGKHAPTFLLTVFISLSPSLLSYPLPYFRVFSVSLYTHTHSFESISFP